jgi:hypothetical protein
MVLLAIPELIAVTHFSWLGWNPPVVHRFFRKEDSELV